MYFAVLVYYRVKLKETEKKDKYLDLDKEMKKLWNRKVTEILIVTGALGTVTNGLVKGLENLEIRRRVETIQTTTLLRSARILRRFLETWRDLHSQTTVRNHRLTPAWKTQKGVTIIIGMGFCRTAEALWIFLRRWIVVRQSTTA